MDIRTGLPVVGMIGGGQLARMTHQAAVALGQSLRVLATSPDDGAALVSPDVSIGSHLDLTALRTFAKDCDVVTFDHEHVPGDHIRALAADGVAVYPSADALRYAQNKRSMRERLAEMGAPMPRWAPVTGSCDIQKSGEIQKFGEIQRFGDEVGWPLVAKSVTGGYDGRGVWVLDSADDAATLIDNGVELIVEEKVALARELAVQVARSPFGQVAAYPVVETVQKDGICVEVLAPAPDLDPDRAAQIQQLAIRIATELDVVGVLAVELFETADGAVSVNELAMRPHNSGHWTIEGARTSQFEQHLRAVLDYPMGDTGLAAPVVVMANLLGGPPGGMSIDERLHHMFAAEPGVKVHLYGKQVRHGRKIGHVTALGTDLADTRRRAARAVYWLTYGKEPA